MAKKKKDTQKNRGEFQIFSIEIGEYCSFASDGRHKERENISFDLNLSLKVDPEKKVLYYIIQATIYHKETKHIYGQITAGMGFEIINFKEIITKSKDGYDIPNGMILSLSAIALSTFRGIVFTTFKGTYLQDQYMPVINPNSFFNFDLVEENNHNKTKT